MTGQGQPRTTTRRRVLRAGMALGASALAGCSSFETRPIGGADVRTPTRNRTGSTDTDGESTETGGTDARVYVPPHFHRTRLADEGTTDRYGVGLMYSLPDFYWRVRSDGTTRQIQPPSDASMQLLAWVWDRESRTVLADASVTAELTSDGDPVTETELVPLLDQRRGLHWARNVSLPTYGEYDVRLRIDPDGGGVRYTGSLSERADVPGSVDVRLPFDRGEMDSIGTIYLNEGGDRGAVKPMSTDAVPLNVHPVPSDLPGRVVGRTTTGAANVAVSRVPADANPRGDDGPYLSLALTTPFNGYSLPRTRITATLARDGQTLFDGRLQGTTDPERGYHYGATVESIEAGDTLALSIGRPPQIARFAGYERAFLRMPDREFTLE